MGILKRDIGSVQSEIDRQFQEAVGATAGALAISTPVDTGYARASWVVEQDAQYSATVVNRVDYIEELEAGHSTQAPDGIIAAAMPIIDASFAEIFR